MSHPLIPLPVDESLYSLDEEASAFFKAQTRIQDDDKLKRHILDLQKKAYEVDTLLPAILKILLIWAFP